MYYAVAIYLGDETWYTVIRIKNNKSFLTKEKLLKQAKKIQKRFSFRKGHQGGSQLIVS